MRKHTVQRARNLRQIQGVDEQARVLDLPAAAGAHEAPKLRFFGAIPLRRLPLEGAEDPELALGVDDVFHGSDTERADQLVLEVRDTDVEAEWFHGSASEVGAEAGPLESTLEIAFLSGVTEAGQSDVEPPRTETVQEASDCLRTADRHNRSSLGVKVPASARGERLERCLVADAFDQHDRTSEEGLGRLGSGETVERRRSWHESESVPTGVRARRMR
jgi:hypothetical protein